MDALPAGVAIAAPRPWLDPAAVPQIVMQGVCKNFGGVAAVNAVSLRIYQGEIFSLVGGSGCGKTTLLRMLAGFAEPSSGTISIDGADMRGVPPYQRPVNMMFQSYALFPHMTVAANVGYGLRRLKLSAAEQRRQVEAALALVQLGGVGARRPHQLSGGQRQRVALARALIRKPRVLLLDEPLSALDKKLREQTQFELMNIQSEVGTTFVLVTHDQEEAMALSTRIAVMERGEVRQVGTPAEIYEYPQSRFVADFIGTTNIFEAVVAEATGGRVRLACPDLGCTLLVAETARVSPGQRVCVSVRPEKIVIGKTADSTGCNCIGGVVWELGYLGNRSIFRVRTAQGRIVVVSTANARRTAEWPIDWNDQVFARWSADSATLLTA